MSDVKHTQFAMKALGLAEMFQATIGGRPLEGPVQYKIELAAPEGPSTGGGKQAVQHIKLVPVGGGPTIVAGSANQLEKTAELRTFSRLAEQHANRFKGAPLSLDQKAYDDFLNRTKRFFSNLGLSVQLEEAQSAEPAPQGFTPVRSADQASKSRLPLIAAVVAGLFVVAAALVFVLR